jgi:hypothetical protein
MLHEHFTELLASRDKLHDQRWNDSQAALKVAAEASEKALEKAFSATQDAANGMKWIAGFIITLILALSAVGFSVYQKQP